MYEVCQVSVQTFSSIPTGLGHVFKSEFRPCLKAYILFTGRTYIK